MKKILLILIIGISALSVKAQIPLSGYIKTIGDADTYPVTLDSLGAGGYQTTYNLTTRNAIPIARRKAGMMVRVASIDSTYVLSGGILNTNWKTFISGVTTKTLSDSLSYYQKLADGIVSGLVPTASGNNLSITAGTYRLNQIMQTASARTFSNIPLSASGLQRILVVFGNTIGVLDTLSGSQSTNPVSPILPANTIRLAFTTVTSTTVSPPSQDLSGYAKLNGGNTFTGKQTINSGGAGTIGLRVNGQVESYAYRFYFRDRDIMTENISDFVIRTAQSDNDFLHFYKGTGERDDLTWSKSTGKFDFKQTPSINGVPIETGGVTSVFGRSGAVTATSGDYTTSLVTEGSNLYYTDTRARTSNSFVSGSGAYNSSTGVITIPTNNNQITNGSGYLTSSTGVASITGAANQVIASASTGVVTLSLPQSIATTSTPTFGGQTLNGALTGTSATFSGNLKLNGTSTILQLENSGGIPQKWWIGQDISGANDGIFYIYNATSGTQVLNINKLNNVTLSGALTGTSATFSSLAGQGNVAVIANNAGLQSATPLVSYLTTGNLTKSAAYTITTTDFGANGTVNVFASGNTTITLPTAAVMNGVQIRVIKTDGAGTTVTLSTGGTVTIQNHSIIVVSDGTNRIELL